VRIIVLEREIAELEFENRAHLGIEPQGRQRTRIASQLLPGLVDVIEIE
jgi:hypothetical protein